MKAAIGVVLLLTLTPALAQEAGLGDVERARGGGASARVITDLEVGEVAGQLSVSLEEFCGDEERGLPGIIELSESTEAGLLQLIDGSPAGRWVGQAPGGALAFIAFEESPPFAVEDLRVLAGQLQSAQERLSELSLVEEPARFGVERHAVFETAKATANAATEVVRKVRERAGFLSHWLGEFRKLPESEQLKFAGASAPPPLREQISARMGALLADALRREQEEAERLQREFDLAAGEQRGAAQRAIAEQRLEAERKLFAETQRLLDAQSRRELEQERRKVAEVEAMIARLRADQRAEAATLRAQLKKTEEHAKQLEAEVSLLKEIESFEAVPEWVRGRLKCLSAPGVWRPMLSGATTWADARYETLEPVPISYSDLASVGALDPGPDGLFTLSAVMANNYDTMRPRWRVGRWNNQQHFFHLGKDALVDMQAHPEAVKRLRELQECLIRYKRAIVAEGLLQP